MFNFENVSRNDFLQLKRMVKSLYTRLEHRMKYAKMPYYHQVSTYITYQNPKLQILRNPMSLPLVPKRAQQMGQASVFQKTFLPHSIKHLMYES